MTNRNTLLCTLLLAASPWATAQAVWRCGSSYGQQPCEGGTAIATPAAPSAADASRAAGAAKADAKRADEMQKTRLAQEKNAPKAGAFGPVDKPEVKKVAEKKPEAGKKKKAKPEKPGDFTAVVPGSGKKK
ncbi:MAG TPA: hypothetical protein VF522_18815 [Ramlibacter sp.]|uniref:hypothetical protein n=1 Tax=Ramlibacter sp. TaxID=1917967 RepID=UPI002ED5C434